MQLISRYIAVLVQNFIVEKVLLLPVTPPCLTVGSAFHNPFS